MAVVVLVAALALGVVGTPADAASGTVGASVTVPSSTSLTNGCTSNAATQLGTVLPGSSATTATTGGAGACSFGFGSTNDATVLRLFQSDLDGTAMHQRSNAVTTQQTTSEYRAVAMADATHGYVAGDSTGVLKTSDGSTWTSTGGASPFSTVYAIAAPTATTVIIGGLNGALYRSTTSGSSSSWAPVGASLAIGTGQVSALASADASLVYLTTLNGIVAHSNDGGATWTAAATGVPASPWNAVTAVPGTNIAFVVGNTGTMLKTTNGGVDWTSVTTPVAFSATTLQTVCASSGTRFTAVGSGTGFSTVDGGSTWTTMPQTLAHRRFSDFPSHCAYTGLTTIVSGTTFGELITSTDGGATWADTTRVTGETIYGVAAYGSTAWAVAGGATILQTTNSTTWSKQTSGAEALLAVAAPTAADVYEVGGVGTIQTTANGGTTWTTRSSGTTGNLYGVAARSASTAWAVGMDGTVLRTTDHGLTWSPQSMPPGTPDLYSVTMAGKGEHPLATTVLWASGSGGTVLRSTDGGATWVVCPTGTTNRLHAIAAKDDRTAIAVGDNGVAVRTTDGGATWSTQTAGIADSLLSVTWVPQSSTVIAAGRQNIKRVSTDDGLTWAVGYASMPGSPRTIVAPDPTTLVEVSDGSAYLSTDAGSTWTTLVGSARPYFGVAAADNQTYFVVADGGRTQAVKPLATSNVPDYGGAVTWASASGLFGVCVQSLTGATAGAGYTVDTTPATAACTATDTDPWSAIPTTQATLATTPGAGAATITLVWGARPPSNAPPGAYQAQVTIDAISPNV